MLVSRLFFSTVCLFTKSFLPRVDAEHPSIANIKIAGIKGSDGIKFSFKGNLIERIIQN